MNFGNTVIFGDSYSTYRGYIPEEYAPYYYDGGHENTDVKDVCETWWHQLMEETGSNLLLNNSWSGSTICYTGYDNVDCSESSSFIFRFRQLLKSGFFEENKVDTIFVFGATNDNWCNAPEGDLKYCDWKKEDLYSVFPAICYFLHLLKENLPTVNIYFIINTYLRPEVNAAIKAACEHYAIPYVDLIDITVNDGHPTVKGMNEIKDQILATLDK